MPGPGYAFLGHEERENVEKVLESWELTRFKRDNPNNPSFVDVFERLVERSFSAAHCVAVNSGTSALLTALAALDIGPGDEVIVPGYTFVASIGSIIYSGATPVLAEVDESLTLDPADVERRITPRTKAIMAVHMLGAPCDMNALTRLAERHGLLLIEDVAQACGASHEGRRLGTIGAAGAFSLNPFKVITSGEGGFFLTNDDHTHQRGYSFQDQGWFPGRTDIGSGDVLFGLNLRMADLAGAVACAQWEKLDHVLSETRRVKKQLADAVPERPGVRRRVLHDAAGECGTLLVYVFDRVADAQSVAAALDTKTLVDSGRHHYANMPQLAELSKPGGRPSPFRRGGEEGGHSYLPGSLPRTDDVLARSVAVAIGVSDSYLGAGFGVTVRSDDEEIAKAADRLSSTLDGVLG
ncbi:aminotransferase class I/II-fold pyridoxal phosphate-dependent enzyme [Streptomyces sp. CAU 1734]|uniref:DegT/DnrJ/EryC1/StrS family aminotransferase n=1 Tax=Streptomyces sp. CAU 1734 TaxID=3140360 RepID=UPI0032617A7C